MKEDTDKEWLTDLMSIYKQASPTIETVTEVDSDGQPASLDSLLEGYGLLPPILQSIKRMQKPSNKELRKIKGDFEKMLEMSIKAGRTGNRTLHVQSRGSPYDAENSGKCFASDAQSA